MSTNTTPIEWTHFPGYVGKTWNPTRGCSRISPGCGGAKGVGGCYAERQAARFAGPGGAYEGLVQITKQGPRWTGKVPLIADKLGDPLTWRHPSAVFTDSMSDLFHESLGFEDIAAVFGVMAQTPRHIYIVLTKRADRMRAFFEWVTEDGVPGDHVVTTCAANRIDIDHIQRPWPLPNVILGVSVENQEYADRRVEHLLATPAACRMVSYEPALGPVDFKRIELAETDWTKDTLVGSYHVGSGASLRVNPNRLDWIVVGGESGPGARPFDIDWARRTVRDCREAGVSVFVKQLGKNPHDSLRSIVGGWAPGDPEPNTALSLKNKKGGDLAEWPEELRVREFPARAARGAS